MRSLQFHTLIARLGKDADFHTFEDGGMRLNLFALTNEWVNGAELTTRWNISYRLGKPSDRALAYFRESFVKGAGIFAQGPLRFEVYTDRDGVERTSVKVHAEKLNLMDPSRTKDAATDAPATPSASATPPAAAARAAPAEARAPTPAPAQAASATSALADGFGDDDPSGFDNPNGW